MNYVPAFIGKQHYNLNRIKRVTKVLEIIVSDNMATLVGTKVLPNLILGSNK